MLALLGAGEPDPSISPCVLEGRAASDACCALRNSQAGMGEDLLLLPTLLRATALAPGTFVELGANDGISGSNTLMLERCFNWTGLLVEGNPRTFAKLQRNAKMHRTAVVLHSSVCPTPGHIHMSGNGMTSANIDAMSPHIRERYYTGTNGGFTLRGGLWKVPCDTLNRLIASAGLPEAVTYFSLDVEGGEDAILNGTDASAFSIVETEELPITTNLYAAAAADPAKERRVQERLESFGLRLVPRLYMPWGRVYANRRTEHALMTPILSPTAIGEKGELDPYMEQFEPGGARFRKRLSNFTATLRMW